MQVGRIIGRAGVTIKELEGRTGCRIQVGLCTEVVRMRLCPCAKCADACFSAQIDHKADSNEKPVHISGNPEAVEMCKQLVGVGPLYSCFPLTLSQVHCD